MGRLGLGRTGKQVRREKQNETKLNKPKPTTHNAQTSSTQTPGTQAEGIRHAGQGSKVGQGNGSNAMLNPSRNPPRARLPTSGFQLGWFRLPHPSAFSYFSSGRKLPGCAPSAFLAVGRCHPFSPCLAVVGVFRLVAVPSSHEPPRPVLERLSVDHGSASRHRHSCKSR